MSKSVYKVSDNELPIDRRLGSNCPQGYKIEHVKHDISNLHLLEISFPTNSGQDQTHSIGIADRSDIGKIAKQLASRDAALPEVAQERAELIAKLVAAAPKAPLILTEKPGFRGPHGFVMPDRSYGSAAGRYRWVHELDPYDPSLGQISGSLVGWRGSVGKLALESPHITLAVLMAMGACLPEYVLVSGEGQLVSETAVINVTGPTTTGKTSIAKVAAGVVGNPNALLDWDITSRGSSEALSGYNNLLLPLDDAEKFVGDDAKLSQAAHSLVQKVPSGRSRKISGGAHDKYPPLTWSTFALSTTTIPLYDLLKLGKKLGSGDKVRGLDVRLPSRSKGGVFGSTSR